MKTITVNIDSIATKDQMRVSLPDIEYLAGSLKSLGQINPITVRLVEGGYEVVAGHRRLAALHKLREDALKQNAASKEWQMVEVRIAGVPEECMEDIQIHENLHQRQPTTQEYYETVVRKGTSGMTSQQIAESLNISQGWVSQLLSIKKASPSVRAAWKAGELSTGSTILLAKSGMTSAQQNEVLPTAKRLSEARLQKHLQELLSGGPALRRRRAGYNFVSLRKARPVISRFKAIVDENKVTGSYVQGVKDVLDALVVRG